jgi:hypothetical protein
VAILRNLLVKIGFDIKDDDLKRLNANMQSAKSSIMSLGKYASAAAASIFGLAFSTATYADDLGGTAALIGINTAELQKFQYAAKKTDTSVEELNTALMRMANLQVAAARGSKEAQNAFKLLGVNIRNSKGGLKDQATLFKEIADKFSKIHSTQIKSALAFQLFGRGATNIIKTLNLGREGIEAYGKELEKTGYILSEDQIKKGSDFIDAWRSGTTALQGFKNMLGFVVMPMVEESMRKMIAYWADNKDAIENTINEALPALEGFFKRFMGFLDGTFAVLGKVVDAVGGLNNALTILGILVGAFVSLKIGAMLWALVTPILAINAALAVNPILAIIEAIIIGLGVIIGLIYVIKKHWQALREFYKHPIDAIRGKGYFSPEAKANRQNEAFSKSVQDYAFATNPTQAMWNMLPKESGGGNNNNVVANTTVNLTVPAGTPQQQQDFLSEAGSKIFDSLHQNWAQQLVNSFPARGG